MTYKTLKKKSNFSSLGDHQNLNTLKFRSFLKSLVNKSKGDIKSQEFVDHGINFETLQFTEQELIIYLSTLNQNLFTSVPFI